MQVDPRLTLVTWDGCAWLQRLKLKCDETLSNFAFINVNLRHYTMHVVRGVLRLL